MVTSLVLAQIMHLKEHAAQITEQETILSMEEFPLSVPYVRKNKV